MNKAEEKNVVILFVNQTISYESAKQDQYTYLSSLARDQGLVITGCFAVPEEQFVLGFSHAMTSCLKHQAKILMLDQASSLFFNYQELSEALNSLTTHNISLMLGDFLISPNYLAVFLTMLRASAGAEKKARSGRIKNSLHLLSKKGVALGGRKYGSNPEEARIIRQILELHKDGKSLEDICLMLAVNNIKTLQNKKWYPTTVKRLIERHKKT